MKLKRLIIGALAIAPIAACIAAVKIANNDEVVAGTTPSFTLNFIDNANDLVNNSSVISTQGTELTFACSNIETSGSNLYMPSGSYFYNVTPIKGIIKIMASVLSGSYKVEYGWDEPGTYTDSKSSTGSLDYGFWEQWPTYIKVTATSDTTFTSLYIKYSCELDDIVKTNDIIYKTYSDHAEIIGNFAQYRAATPVILNKVQGKPVTKVCANAFTGYSGLSVANLPSTVSLIDTNAFKDCTTLTKVTIDNTNDLTINSYAFEGCTALETVEVSGDIDCINNYAFSDCANLTFKNPSFVLPTIGENAFNANAIVKVGPEFTYRDITYRIDLYNGWAIADKVSSGTKDIVCVEETIKGYDVLYLGDNFTDDVTSIDTLVIPSSLNDVDPTKFGPDKVDKVCTDLLAADNDTWCDSDFASFAGTCYSELKFGYINLHGIVYVKDGTTTNIIKIFMPDAPYYIYIEKNVFGNDITSVPMTAFADVIACTKLYVPSTVTNVTFPITPFVHDYNTFVIYLETSAVPSTWNSDWNDSNLNYEYNSNFTYAEFSAIRYVG